MLTDLTMPRMGGRELAERMADARPGTRIVFMSGFADDGAPPPEISGLPTLFIRKPFTLDVLTSSIRGVLDAPLDTP
jgi:FixJ family two-component response regulator